MDPAATINAATINAAAATPAEIAAALAHVQRSRAANRARYARRRDYVLERSKAWYAANREHVLQRRKEARVATRAGDADGLPPVAAVLMPLDPLRGQPGRLSPVSHKIEPYSGPAFLPLDKNIRQG